MDLGSALAIAIVVTLALVFLLVARPGLTASRGGRILAFLVFFLLPVGLLAAGFTLHVEHAKSTEFCLSCHEMEAYGRSLLVDDAEWVAASHFQNQRVPRDFACYTCHTDYTMFGGVKAKMRGLKHVYVHYLGDIPDQIELYTPYQNRECLHCHGESRLWAESWAHADDLEALRSGATSCMESGCHDVMHEVAELDGVELWDPESGPLARLVPTHGAASEEE